MRWSLESLEKHLLIGSTLVEGTTFSEEEAARVLAGRTVSGHSVEEIRELLNYRAAVEWLIGVLEPVPFLSVDLVLGFHQRLFAGFGGRAGTFKTHDNSHVDLTRTTSSARSNRRAGSPPPNAMTSLRRSYRRCSRSRAKSPKRAPRRGR